MSLQSAVGRGWQHWAFHAEPVETAVRWKLLKRETVPASSVCPSKAIPNRHPCVQVSVMDLSTHVIQNMTRRGFEALARLTALRELTLVNSSTVSSAGALNPDLCPHPNLNTYL